MAERTVTAVLKAQVSGFLNGVQQAHEKYKGFTKELESNHKKRQALTDISNLALGVGTVLTGAFLYATKVTMEFDKQMSATAAAANATSGEMGKLRAAALSAGAATSFSATEAAKGQEELAKAGLTTTEILTGGLTGALNLAAGGSVDVAFAAEAAATALKLFGLAGKDIPHVADLMVSAADSAQGGVKEMSDALNQSGLVANQFGLSIEETVGTLGAFASAGMLGSDAGTSFKTMLLRLAAPSGEATELMNELGIAAYDAAGEFVGMESLAGQLKAGLQDLTQEQRDAALATIFGADAIRAANVLYKEGAAGIAGWENRVDEAGAAAEKARKLTDNLAGDLERLGGTLETALITGGSGSTDILRGLTQSAESAVQGFMALPDPIEGAITGLVGIGGVTALAVGGMGRMIVSASETREALNDLAVTGTRTEKGMTRAVRAMGRVAVGIGVMQVASAAFGSSAAVPLDALTRSLVEFAETGELTGSAMRVLGKDMANLQYDVIIMGTGLWDQIGLGIAGVAEGISGLGAVFDESLQHATERIGQLDTALATMVQSGKAAEAAEVFRKIKNVALEQGYSLDEVNAKFPQYTAAAEVAAIQQKALAEGIQSATDAGMSFNEILMTLHGTALAFAGAEITAEAAIDSFKEALDESGGSMDVTTEKGRAAKSGMLALVDAAIAAAQAKYEETDSVTEANAVYDDYIDQLRATLKQAGYTEDEIDSLIDKFAAIPDNVYTGININVRVKETYVRQEEAQARNLKPNADGNLYSYAMGGEHHVAQIARAGDMRLWAEPETGGEAYIPLAASKRDRSLAIWRETGRRLGAFDPGIQTQELVKALVSSSGQGPVTINMSAWSDRFSWPQVERELANHGVV